MTLTNFVGLLAGGMAVTGFVNAQASNDTMAQIADLQTQIATLKAQNGDNWLTSERAEEIKGLVRDVLADADTRASLQGGGASAGYADGFFISSSDGNWKFRVNGLEQVRFVYNSDSNNGAGDTVSTFGFENRRTQLTFSGNIVDPSWTWMVRMNNVSETDPYDTDAGLNFQDMWASKSLSNGFSVTAGQFKTPFMRESLLNDGVQLTAERSVVDYYFSSGYQQGLRLDYSADQFRFSASWGNGFLAATNPNSSVGTDFATSFQGQAWDGNVASFAVSGRLEVKLSGDWKQFDKETSFRGEGSGLMIGGAVGYENARGENAGAGTDSFYGNGFGPTGSPFKWTVDATAMFGGANLGVAFVGQNINNFEDGANTENQDYYGMVAQGGYMLSDAFEVFGRWEWMSFNNEPVDSGAVQNILTFGVNYYFAKNNCKWTLDVGIPLNDPATQNSFEGTTGAGWNDGTGDQWNIRTQLQVAF